MTSHRHRRGYVRPFDEMRHARPSDVQPLAADPMADAVEAASTSLAKWGATDVRVGLDTPGRDVEWPDVTTQTLWFEATDADGRVWRAECTRETLIPMDVLTVAAIILRGQGTEVTR